MRKQLCQSVAATAAAALLLTVLSSADAERTLSSGASSAVQQADSAIEFSADGVVQYAGGTIVVDIDRSAFAIPRGDLLAWVRDSARATATYFGRFPVSYARLLFEPSPGAEVRMGYAIGKPEPRIVVSMGRHTTAASLAAESLLVHEMVHLAIPDLDLRHLWLHEGIATYVEHIARAQAGIISARAMWRELMRELPAGLPDGYDVGGLDDTPSEGRRYWGGALFCLLADIEIRRATGNRLGLQDALRALQRQGGSLARLWTIGRTLDVADRATQTNTMTRLYRVMGGRPMTTDLDKLWRDLGVRRDRTNDVFLDDSAPLAAIRRAITERPSAPLLVTAPRLLRVVDASAGVSRSR